MSKVFLELRKGMVPFSCTWELDNKGQLLLCSSEPISLSGSPNIVLSDF